MTNQSNETPYSQPTEADEWAAREYAHKKVKTLIGICSKTTGNFWLIQNEKFGPESVKEVGEAIATLLNNGHTVDFCRRFFG